MVQEQNEIIGRRLQEVPIWIFMIWQNCSA